MKGLLIRKKNGLVLATALVAQIVLLGAQATGHENVRLLRVWANYLIIPSQQATTALFHGVSSVWHRYLDLRHASEENRQLMRQLESLTLEKNRLEAEVQASKRLQTLLNLKEAVPLESVAAEVIGASPNEAFKSITLNKGANAGLTENLPVITSDGIVGRIVRVYARSSVVQLVTDSESGVGVVFERSRVHGVAKGTGGRELNLDYVVNEEKVSSGDVLRTSGEDQIYPKDLLVGLVTAVQSGKGIFKDIRIMPAAHLSRLEEVLVMKKAPGHE